MFSNLKLNSTLPAYIQIKTYIKQLILKGLLQKDEKLPSTRELSQLLKVSRNTVINAYEDLQDEGFIFNIRGRGAFVCSILIKAAENTSENSNIYWNNFINDFGLEAENLDIIKHEPSWKKGMISFKSIAPDSTLFDMEQFKKAFYERISLEGDKLLNYGYAQGYKPLIDYLLNYMQNKGINTKGKGLLITNGFTEGFDIVLSTLTNPKDKILCENPTHNTAIKLMKLHKLDIVGIPLEKDGMNINILKDTLSKNPPKLAYLVPSYHNPTGIITSPEKRYAILSLLESHGVPIIEDGFNEELRYSGAHISPIAALSGTGNNVIYIGSFSKILFPGIRIGWILADSKLINYLESIKRSRNIHTSALDQALLYQYLMDGNFERFLKKARKVYKDKYEFALYCAHKYIPCKQILGEGGLHIFIKLCNLNARIILKECIALGVIFTPGDIFYTYDKETNTLRLGFSRNSKDEIEKGFKIIGEVVKAHMNGI